MVMQMDLSSLSQLRLQPFQVEIEQRNLLAKFLESGHCTGESSQEL